MSTPVQNATDWGQLLVVKLDDISGGTDARFAAEAIYRYESQINPGFSLGDALRRYLREQEVSTTLERAITSVIKRGRDMGLPIKVYNHTARAKSHAA